MKKEYLRLLHQKSEAMNLWAKGKKDLDKHALGEFNQALGNLHNSYKKGYGSVSTVDYQRERLQEALDGLSKVSKDNKKRADLYLLANGIKGYCDLLYVEICK